MTPTSSPVQARLRQETRPAHMALETALPIGRGRIDHVSYRDHLQFLLSFHEPVERHLQRIPELAVALPDLDDRCKTRLLRDDLGAAADAPQPARVPAPQTLPDGLGVLYVLEGATLGARSLLPRLRRAGVIPGTIGSRYMEGHGRRTALMWRRLCGALERLQPYEADEAATWAKLTFETLLTWRRSWEAGR